MTKTTAAGEDDMRCIRYTAAVAKVRGTYPHISDIVDDVPVASQVNYWNAQNYATPYHPGSGFSSNSPRSAPSHLKSGDRYTYIISMQWQSNSQL